MIAESVAQELRLLSERMERAEHALSILLDQRELALQKETLHALQEIDVSSQSVVALADFLCAIAAEMSDGDAPDIATALSQVRLEALASRLAGQKPKAKEHAGDILF